MRNFTTAPTRGEVVCSVPYWVNDHVGLPKPELANLTVTQRSIRNLYQISLLTLLRRLLVLHRNSSF